MKRILIVDDEPFVLRVLRRSLEQQGYTVAVACDGRGALQQILGHPPAVLITDIVMPRMSGRELCLALERQLPERTFPILLMTSRAERVEREWSGRIANLRFLEKPISPRQLIATLSALLDGPGKEALPCTMS